MTALQILGGASVLGSAKHPTRRVSALTPEVMDQCLFVDTEDDTPVTTGTIGGGPGAYNDTFWFNTLMWTTTQNGKIGWYVDVAGGTYTIEFFTGKRNDYPQVRIQVDGVNVGVLTDLYQNVAANVRTTVRATGVAITRGRHLIQLHAPSKLAASAGYVMAVSGLGLVRTGP